MLLTSVELAKEILSTLSGALLTMTTFTFSTIMVVLTTYSSDFTPRVVENFLTDESTTRVLGVFIGGFFYCITSLFFMRNTFEYTVFAATIAIIYSVVCIFYFIAFVYSVSSSIQVSKLIDRLYRESSEVIDRTMDFRAKYEVFHKEDMDIRKSKEDLYCTKNGYMEEIDFTKMLNLIEEMNCKIFIDIRIGDFIYKNQKIATIYYNTSDLTEQFTNSLLDCFMVEAERKIYSDYNFSIQKITEIALRAISPGINDPNTSIQCIKILGVLLAELSEVDGDLICISEEDKKSKIIYKDIDLKSDIYFTFYQIVHYGKEDISVIISLFEALDIIARKTILKNIDIVKEFADYVYDMSIENFENKLDIQVLVDRNNKIQSI